MWTVVKDLWTGNLKKVKVSELYEVMAGKRLVSYAPKHLQDFSSRKQYVRLKRDPDGVQRVQRIRVLQIAETEQQIDTTIKNPSCNRKLKPELLSEYLIVGELKDVRMKRKSPGQGSKCPPNIKDQDIIVKRFKGIGAGQGAGSSQNQQKSEESIPDGVASSNMGEQADGIKQATSLGPDTQMGETLPNSSNSYPNSPENSPTVKIRDTHGTEKIMLQINSAFSTNFGKKLCQTPFNPRSPENSLTGKLRDTNGTDEHRQQTSPGSASNHRKTLLYNWNYNISSAENSPTGKVRDTHTNKENESRPCTCCRLVLQEIQEMRADLVELKADMKGKTSSSKERAIISHTQWPIFNAVSVELPAPPTTPKDMIYCGDSAKCLGVEAVDLCVFGNVTLRSKVQELALLMFPENLDRLWLQTTKKEANKRELFPRDALLAITNLINYANKSKAQPGQTCCDIQTTKISEHLSKILFALRNPPDDNNAQQGQGTTKPNLLLHTNNKNQ